MINTPNKYNNNSKTATATAATATTTNERHSQKIPLPLSLPLHLLPSTPPPQLTSPHLTPHTPLEVSKTSSQSRCIWATQSQNGDLGLKKAVVQ